MFFFRHFSSLDDCTFSIAIMLCSVVHMASKYEVVNQVDTSCTLKKVNLILHCLKTCIVIHRTAKIKHFYAYSNATFSL